MVFASRRTTRKSTWPTPVRRARSAFGIRMENRSAMESDSSSSIFLGLGSHPPPMAFAVTGSSPDVAVHVTANAIGGGWLPSPRNIELDESLSIADRFSIRIPNADLARRTGVGHVDFLVVRREANTIGAAQFVG